MRDQARREAELILGEAHAEARAVQRRSIAENERLQPGSPAGCASSGRSAGGDPENEPAASPPSRRETPTTQSASDHGRYGLPGLDAA